MEKIQIRDKHNGSATLFLNKDPDSAFYLYADPDPRSKISANPNYGHGLPSHNFVLNQVQYGSVIR
jgi:hypothetical protein